MAPPTLTETGAHVWYTSLRQPTGVVSVLESTLAQEERRRADRFHFEHLRQSFIVARGILRSILAFYLSLDPTQVPFEYSRAGKPHLAIDGGAADISFNLSHSHEVAVYAVTRQRQVGVDIEHIRPMPELMELAARTFSAGENRQLKQVAEEERLGAFFNCWTRKEAFIKASGEGLSFPLDQFEVSLKPGEPARLLTVFGSEAQAARWSLHKLDPGNGYVAALAVEGPCDFIEYRHWNHTELVPSI